MTTITILSTIALLLAVATAIISRKYYALKGEYDNQKDYINKYKASTRAVLDESADRSKSLTMLISAVKKPSKLWHISAGNPGEISVIHPVFVGSGKPHIMIVAKTFVYDDEEGRDYAVACAEELADKLNERP